MPLVSRTFDQLIDFTRTSAGTFVGSNGLIQSTPASRNLLTFTQELVSGASWGDSIGGTGVAPTLTANAAAAPDGTMTADRLQFSLAGGTALADLTRRRQTYTTPATTHTFSIYLRSTDGSSSYNMHIVGPTGATTNIVVDGTWQRFTVTGAGTGAVVTYAVGLRGAQSPANSNTADVLAWGAQLETGSTATDYTRNFGGLFPPRFDYDPVTLAPRGLLIEEQRTNLLTYSEQFDNAAWSKTATVTANTLTSPDGTTNADLVSTVANFDYVRQVITATANAQYTTTFFVKPVSGSTTIRILLTNAAQTEYAGSNFGLTGDGSLGTAFTTGTGVLVSRSITNVGNGWYRCSVTATNNTTSLYALIDNHSGGVMSFGVWGAQLEAGAFATSYIPTVASQVTRTADTALIQAPNFAPWYNQSEGTIVVRVSPYQVSVQTGIYALNDNTINNRMDYRNVSLAFVTAGGVSQASMTTTALTPGGVNTVGFAYRTNDLAASANGVSVVTDTSATIPTVTQLRIGALDAGANQLNGHIRSIRYYPVRLSNAQLQALTA